MKTSHTDKQWEKWGSQNPYRGVLGVETTGLTGNKKEEFFQSGQHHIEHVLAMLDRHFGPDLSRNDALDFGCGVGRLLIPLASHYARVVGVDVSDSMLGEAKINIAGRANVELIRGLENIPTQKLFDLVHSYIVMQHIRPKQGMLILARLLGLIRPGGYFAIHFTLGDTRVSRKLLNSIRYRFPPAHWLYNIARKRPISEPVTEMSAYSSIELFDLMRANGCTPVLVEVLDQNRHVGIFMYGRKSFSAMPNQPGIKQ